MLKLRICMLASAALEIASFFIGIKQIVRMQYSKVARKLYAQHTNPPLHTFSTTYYLKETGVLTFHRFVLMK